MMAAMPLELPVAVWAEELRRVLDARDAALTAWAPPMDVLESADSIELRLDVAGVPLETLHVTVRAGRLVVEGEKPHNCRPGAAFHVAERACGRFARTVPLTLAYDASGIRATLTRGELRIVIPRIEERRGREITVPVVAS
jgi:HSP20 family protein